MGFAGRLLPKTGVGGYQEHSSQPLYSVQLRSTLQYVLFVGRSSSRSNGRLVDHAGIVSGRSPFVLYMSFLFYSSHIFSKLAFGNKLHLVVKR